MNLAAIQALGGMNLQSSSNASRATQSVGNTFGSVFSGLTTASVNMSTMPAEIQNGEVVSEDTILAIFGATTIDGLKEALKNMSGEEFDLYSIKGLDELAGILGLDSEKVIDSLLPLLKKAGLQEESLEELSQTNDIWFVLDTIDKMAPQFFKELNDALEGKGAISKQQAVDVLTLLKTVQLVAPKTDLVMKQEQQVFSLQGFLNVAGESFEQSLQLAKPKMQHLMEAVRSDKQAILSNTPINQQTTGEEAGKQGSDTNPSSSGSKETVTQVFNTAQTHATQKVEISLTELENRNNARNEALIREMQAVFKRSNFGQAGGTNRLLVKLYPEHLGQVRIELVQTNGIMTARILASTALGKEMLDSQLHQLRNAFVQQNVQVDRIDIAQTLQDTSRNDREQAFNQHFKEQQQEDKASKEQNDDQELTFQEYMIELEA